MALDTGSHKKFMSQINVTPFVDVMLVLLIIFMVAAPMMQSGIDVKLPKVTAAAIDAKDEPIIVTIDEKRTTYLGDTPLSHSQLRKKLIAIRKSKRGSMVLLRADKKVPYGFVVNVMAEIRKSGIEKIGMVTEPIKQ
ncbi:MAG: protein TolR [Thermodesulfobacteriota bacterium]|nr:MAG: protein TolR [Thermodesulfobacteriota bacterium]